MELWVISWQTLELKYKYKYDVTYSSLCSLWLSLKGCGPLSEMYSEEKAELLNPGSPLKTEPIVCLIAALFRCQTVIFL